MRGGWRGGDGDFSVALPDGRTLWLFGDSIVQKAKQRDYSFVRNSAVIQERDGSLDTTAATQAGQNTVGFDDPPDQRWLWPGAGFVVHSQLWLFESEMRKTGPGFWGFGYVRSWLFQMDLRGRRLVELRRVPLPVDGVIWGAAVIPKGPWLYIFGVHDHAASKHPHVARVAADGLLGPWAYWDGSAWSGVPLPHADWHGSVASEFSVIRGPFGIALVSASGGLKSQVLSYQAHNVTGPWAEIGVIYRAHVPPGRFAYNALLHPLPGGDYLLSYNTASAKPDAQVPLSPAAMRPRFADIPRSCL